MKYQQETDVQPWRLSITCNRIVSEGGQILHVLPNILSGYTTYIILYVI